MEGYGGVKSVIMELDEVFEKSVHTPHLPSESSDSVLERGGYKAPQGSALA